MIGLIKINLVFVFSRSVFVKLHQVTKSVEMLSFSFQVSRQHIYIFIDERNHRVFMISLIKDVQKN